MDCWASIDHKLRYKLPSDIPEQLEQEMLLRAEEMRDMDKKMDMLNSMLKKYIN